jgi:hypothetical protein
MVGAVAEVPLGCAIVAVETKEDLNEEVEEGVLL